MIYSLGTGKLVPIGVETNNPKNRLPVGTVLRLNGYDNPDFVVIKNEGINDRFPSYGASYKAINLKTGMLTTKQAYELKYLSEKQDNRIQTYITDIILEADDIIDAMDFSKQKNVERAAAAEARERSKLEELDSFKTRYAFLERREGSTKTPWALGAANIRIELKRAFPGVKFSVTSEGFSMGCAIRIGWTAGPTVAAVEAFVDKYEYGTFDSMTDCAGCKDEQFTGVFGGARFVTTSRREEVQNG